MASTTPWSASRCCPPAPRRDCCGIASARAPCSRWMPESPAWRRCCSRCWRGAKATTRRFVPRLRDVGEVEVVRRLTADRARGPGVALGPGDDAAVLEPEAGRQLVVTTDAFVEGRHFLPSWGAPADWGARLAAANLSDLAAMAATPRWALLSMGLRAEHELESLLELQAGLVRALGGHGAVLVGGNVVAVEGAEWFDLTLLGEVKTG